MKIPPSIAMVVPDAILMTDGQSFMPRSGIRESEARRFPELVIENNVEEIREAALTSMRSLIILTKTMQLFSFDDLFREASEQLDARTKELEHGLLTKLPTAATGATSDDITAIDFGDEAFWRDIDDGDTEAFANY